MDDREFLLAAEALAKDHPDDCLAEAFLKAFRKEPQEIDKCISLASQVIIKLLDVKDK